MTWPGHGVCNKYLSIVKRTDRSLEYETKADVNRFILQCSSKYLFDDLVVVSGGKILR